MTQRRIDDEYLNLIWLISLWCNYTCRYCPQDHARSASHAFDLYPVETWLDAIGRIPREVGVYITGGEPLLDVANMRKFLAGLEALPNVDHIRLDSNASVDPRHYAGLGLTRVHANFSFHPTQTPVDRLLRNVDGYRKAGFAVEMVNYVCDPDQIQQYEQYRDQFAAQDLVLNPSVLLGGPRPTAEHLALHSRYSAKLDVVHKSMLVSPRGLKCRAFDNQINMDWKGDLYHCSGTYAPRNLVRDGWEPHPDPEARCPQSACTCIEQYSMLEHTGRDDRRLLALYAQSALRFEPGRNPTPLVVISGYYGFGNTGDEAILSAVVADLKAVAPAAVPVVISDRPDATQREHGVYAVSRSDGDRVQDLIRLADLVISGGGGLLQDSDPADISSYFHTPEWGIPYYVHHLALAQMYGVPTLVYAQGVGPLRDPAARRLVASVLDRVDAITVRDRASTELLQEIGVTRPPVAVTADPALLLEPAPAELVGELLTGFGLAPGERFTVAFCPRPWGEREGFWAGPGEAMTVAADFCVQYLEAQVIFLPFQAEEHCDDWAIARTAAASMSHQDGVTVLPVQSPAVTAGVLGAANLVVGMRLHSLILAARAGVPAIGLAYDPKVFQFLIQLGLPELCLPLEQISAERLVQTIGWVLEHYDEVADRVRAGAVALQERLAGNRSALRQFIGRQTPAPAKRTAWSPNRLLSSRVERAGS